MSIIFDLTFPRASSLLPASGVIKTSVDDFYVEELLMPELLSEGEHAWLWLEKQGQNTEFVADGLAKFAGVKQMDVGFSGLKDRWAVTRQWFSIYLGNKPEPDWQAFDMDGVQIIKLGRNKKKLRRGEHQANHFKIYVRQLKNADDINTALIKISKEGFPNYFGDQRFGLNGANLERGERFFNGKLKASRSQRSFYLSAARSYLYNLNLADAIRDQTWLSDTKGGPLYGDEEKGISELTNREQEILESHPVFASAIHKNRLKLERRPYSIVPQNFSWEHDAGSLLLSFTLPTGVFATSLISELMNYDVGLGVSASKPMPHGDD